MPKKIVEVEIEDSPKLVLEHVAKLYAAWKVALADGFQPGQDLPIGVSALVMEMPGLLENMSHLKADLSDDKVKFLKGGLLGLEDLAKAVLS